MMPDLPECRLAIVGNSGGTNVGESLRRAAIDAGISALFFDAYEAAGASVLRSFNWHFRGRRPGRLVFFSRKLLNACTQWKPRILIATGAAPITARDLAALQHAGITCVNYSTDDPWNRNSRADWHLRALPHYAIVFSTRRANIENLRAVGCKDVRYLPFGYDDGLFLSPSSAEPCALRPGVLFVGGADSDRAEFILAFVQSGVPITLVGSYWERFRVLRGHTVGHKSPQEVRALTVSASVNLCLVRRANRDGHVMRSFEIAAIGGCMLAEDTAEHRELFGGDGECAVYFRTPLEAAARARALLADERRRRNLSVALRARVRARAHTYGDRLRSLLSAALDHNQVLAGNGRICREDSSEMAEMPCTNF